MSIATALVVMGLTYGNQTGASNERVHALEVQVPAVASQVADDHTDLAVVKDKVDRMDRNIQRIAKKLDVYSE